MKKLLIPAMLRIFFNTGQRTRQKDAILTIGFADADDTNAPTIRIEINGHRVESALMSGCDSVAEVLEAFPFLTKEQVHAVLKFAADSLR